MQGCDTNYENGFSKFIQEERTGDITIPAQSKLTKPFSLTFPVGVEGIQK